MVCETIDRILQNKVRRESDGCDLLLYEAERVEHEVRFLRQIEECTKLERTGNQEVRDELGGYEKIKIDRGTMSQALFVQTSVVLKTTRKKSLEEK